jgi:hypothetical protein
MTENLTKESSKSLQITLSSDSLPVIRKRGRPKGAKNKPKTYPLPGTIVAHKKRGRPKGAKNKQKVSLSSESTNIVGSSSPIIPRKRGRPPKLPVAEQPTQLEEHPLLKAVKWLEKYMHPTELQYYKNRANKLGASLHVTLSSDILGFFNVQNPEICKQIKKNNFIVNTNPYDLH